jgi:hypothetical protein
LAVKKAREKGENVTGFLGNEKERKCRKTRHGYYRKLSVNFGKKRKKGKMEK